MAHRVPVLVVGSHMVNKFECSGPLARNPEREICCEVEDHKEAVEKVRELKPHVVVLVMSKPLMGRPECIDDIRRIAPAMKFLMVGRKLDQIG